jgi:formylglycine-generating enzyme
MTVRRWLVGTVTLAVLGSVAFDFGQQPVQSAQAEPLRAAGYCEGEVTAKAETTNPSQTAGAAESETQAGAETGSCPADMVEVAGEHCQIVEQICEEFISEKKDRCAKYRNKVRCLGKTRAMHFCVDRYEYPNQAGAKPTVAVTWDEARELCATEGKRLCTADEWTQACEGPEHTPYPYGFVRDGEACNHDKPYIIPDDNAYQNPQTRAKEVERVSQSEPSGSRASCASAYGVFDMTGNVDEWVLNEAGSERGPEYQSGLKGGYWGPVRNRCRPATTDHNRWHHGYQIGFRCCADPSQSNQATSQPPNRGLAPADGAEQLSADNQITRS